MFPTLSVIFCVNRDSPFLKPAIESVLNQTQPDFEFLIAADAHAEGLVQRLTEICGNDPRVKIYEIAIAQLQFSLNFVANFAKGDYLIRMDADDLCVPERFAVQAEAIRKSNADVIGSWAQLIDENDNPVGVFEPPSGHRGILKRMIFASAIYHPTVAIRREFFMKLKGYCGGLVTEDYDLWLRAVRAGGTFENIPQHLLKYRLHPGQGTGTRLGRAEQVGHQMRELLLTPSFSRLAAFTVALSKSLVGPGFTNRLRTVILGRSGGLAQRHRASSNPV